MPRQFIFANFVAGELLDAVTATTTELRVTPSMAAKIQLFDVSSNLECRLTLWDGQSDPEIVGCIANPQDGTLLVNRGQESTTPVAWPAGTQVRVAMTAEVINQALQTVINTQELLQSQFLALSGGQMTGAILLPDADPTDNNEAARKRYVDSVLGNKLPLTGGTMLGAINMNGNRILALPAAVASTEPTRKAELDTSISDQGKVNSDRSGALITSGTATALTVTLNQGITSLTDGLTIRIRPHANVGDSAVLNVNSIGDIPIQEWPGELLTYGAMLQDIPYDLVYSNSYTAWLMVQGRAYRTGDIKPAYNSTAPVGWFIFDDSTIGNTGSAATHADANFRALYIQLWNVVSDANAPVNTGRGASALADWNANKRMTIPKHLGRQLVAAGAGSGLTSRTIGAVWGAESYTIAQGNLPNVSFTTSISSGQGSHFHAYTYVGGNNSGNGSSAIGENTTPNNTSSATLPSMTGTTASGGSGTALAVVDPSVGVNFMVKL